MTAQRLTFRLFDHISKHLRLYISLILIAYLIFGFWPFNFTEKNNAVINPAGGLEIARYGTAYTSAFADKLHDLKQFAIYIDLTTASGGLGSLEKIFGYFIGKEDENFFLAQWKDGLELRIRTERNAGGMIFGEEGVFKKEERAACLIIYDGLKMHLYKSGTLIRREKRGPLSFSNWDKAYPLVVGTDAQGHSQWRGTIYEAAIFDRAIMPGEVQGFKGSGVQGKEEPQATSHKPQGKQNEDRRPLIHYIFKPENTYETTFRGGKALAVRDLGKGEPSDLVIPEQFMPYQRVYLGWDPDWMRNRSDLLDVVVNLIGFIPFGVLLMLSLSKTVAIGQWPVVSDAAERQGKTADSQQPTADSRQKQTTRQENPPVSPFMKGGGFGSGSFVKGGGLGSGPFAKGGGLVVAVVLTVVVGFVVSFAIEYLQAYLPSRDSSLRDLICNTVGTAMGAVAAAWMVKRTAVSGRWTVASGQ